ncbi:unnamed protein product [Toxocara canis]|uniref:Ovule protein n=1 Tax=Toxocara canis TaxID=6265 RepID=A0A183VCH7_TOXCA|nr:unnamed protein product [Toxocara canis]
MWYAKKQAAMNFCWSKSILTDGSVPGSREKRLVDSMRQSRGQPIMESVCLIVAELEASQFYLYIQT